MNDRAEAILAWWYEDSKRWWEKNKATDEEIRTRFGEDHAQAVAGALESWRDEPRSCLALVILIDQFSRNMFRGSPESWAYDGQAQQVVLQGLDRQHDQKLDPRERLFFYMPLMHAEDLALQERCVALFEALSQEAPQLEQNLKYAVQHRDIVKRFGRFPHRNELLGRSSSPEELEFLKQPGSSF